MRAKAWVAAVVAVAAVAGGCASAPTQGRTRSERAVAPPAASDIGAVPRDRLRTGGTLRWPLPGFPAQWNYYQASGATGEVDAVMRGLLPYVMRSDARGVTRPDPDYLTSATVRAASKGRPQTVAYTINPKARWSDGTPLTWRDFAAQAAALSGRDPRYQISTSTGYAQIASVRRGSGDGQAVVTFTRPFADWAALFSPLYPAVLTRSPRAFDSGWVDRVPITAGPFRLGGIDRTAKTVTLARDPRWWGRPALLDTIVFRTLDPAAAPGAFANGEVDLLDIGGDAGAYARARQVPGAVIRRAGGPDWRQLTLNAAGPVLSDVRVRQAIAVGIDRRVIAHADLQGLDWPDRTLGNHFFVNTQAGYADNSGSLGEYRPDAARALLAEAGWRQVAGRAVKGGHPLTLRMVVPAGAPVSVQEAQLVQAMLRLVGITVTIRTVPASDFFDRYVVPGDFDLAPFSWLGNPFPVSSQRSIFARPRGSAIQQNYARAGDPRIDGLMDEATGRLDPSAARALTNAADVLLWRESAVIPLYQRPQLVAVRAGLANIGARGMADLAYEDIGHTP